MGFADRYLQKHAIREALIAEACDPSVQLIVCIPAFKESGLTKSLDSLYICTGSIPTEVIVLINSPEGADEDTLKINDDCYRESRKWLEEHPHKNIKFHNLHEKELVRKHFGAGLARKLAMDEATRRFSMINRSDGIILSLDADTVVEPNYLSSIENHFRINPESDGCSINFEHPIEGEDFSEDVYNAIINYELYQRYFLECLRYTKYPFAYHTVGSAFAVKASSYASQGGMSKRQAGEDFYFIQKLAVLGNYTECNSTTVHPSPRPSNRVPFGTGPEIQKQLKNPDKGICTNPILIFAELKKFYCGVESLYHSGIKNYKKQLAPILNLYLEQTNFDKDIEEIRANSASPESFNSRFLRKFNQFWMIKFLHFSEENGFKKINLLDAVNGLFSEQKNDQHFENTKDALKHFRLR